MVLIDTFANRLQKALNRLNMKQVDLVEKTGLDKTLINKYLAGVMKAKQDKLTILAEALDVNEIWLMGYDVPLYRDISFDNDSNNLSGKSNKSAVVFVYGTIPAGIPMECIEDIIDTEEISADMLRGNKQYFGLKIKGNSMKPDYLDGDVIILQKQDNCENGDDCVVMVNGNERYI